MPLKKQLTLPMLVLYGVGIILGAGIYALIGTGAAMAGTMLWLAFIISMLLAIFTGMSYVELSSAFPREAAEYVYTRKAFGNEMLSFTLSWILIVSSIISAAVVALAFGGYLAYIIGGNASIYAAALILLLSLLSFIGMRESAMFNNLASLIEAGGLIAVIIIGVAFGHGIHSVNFLAMPPGGPAGILSAVAVIYFAFIGFEYIANVSEEAKDSRRTVPKALLMSLGITSLIYVLLSVSVFLLASPATLASSPAPLTAAVKTIFPAAGLAIAIVALFATSNTVLIILIGASRIIYGVSRNGSLPRMFSLTSGRGTPYTSIAIVGIIAAIASLFGNIKNVAELTNMGVFIVYFFVNASLIKLRGMKNGGLFRGPRLRNIPILAIFGAVGSAVMIIFFDKHVWIAEAAILLMGISISLVHGKHRERALRRKNIGEFSQKKR